METDDLSNATDVVGTMEILRHDQVRHSRSGKKPKLGLAKSSLADLLAVSKRECLLLYLNLLFR